MPVVWIDLDNSPHVPLFAPIIRDLRAAGIEVTTTGRDAFQVRELVDLHAVECQMIGRHYGKRYWRKLLGIGVRALQLMPTAMRWRPALAVSHGSRSQLVASWLLGIPSLLLVDYEHAKTFAIGRPSWVMVPEVIPPVAIRTPRERVLQYPGIKEDVYVPSFKPDLTVRSRLGLSPSDLVVTIRPPATEAHYHNPESEHLLRDVIEHLAGDSRVRMIMLPRNHSQAAFIRETWSCLIDAARLILPREVEDGLNLIWLSDLVISGGGTMNREAAALGVPVYTIFRGPLGEVDRSLAAQSRLTILANSVDVHSKLRIAYRDRTQGHGERGHQARSAIVQHIVRLVNGARLERVAPLETAR